MWHYGNGYGWGMMGGWGWFFSLVFLGLFIWLIIKVIVQSSRGGTPHEKSAMDILKERYAKGEISKEEFEEKKKDILN